MHDLLKAVSLKLGVWCVSLKALSKLDKWTKEEVALLKYIYSKSKRNGNKSSTELTYDLRDATQTLQLIYIYLLFTETLSEASRWKFVCQEAIYKETERKGSSVPNYTRTGLKISDNRSDESRCDIFGSNHH